MTAIGKILALLNLVVGLGLLTWATSVYVQRPAWYQQIPEGEEKGNAVTFAQLKLEIETLTRAANNANEAWGLHLELLKDREASRDQRRKAYAQRLQWARTGNPNDLIDEADPKSGQGFYEPVLIDDELVRLREEEKKAIDDGDTAKATEFRKEITKLEPFAGLHDLRLESKDVKGVTRIVPKGRPVLAIDGKPLRGADNLLATLDKDVEEINKLNAEILKQRKRYEELSGQLALLEDQLIKMGVIRESVQSELFFLDSFEVNVLETRDTVARREKQLRARLKELGVVDP
ncbi:MAG: hypothetical protein L0241_31145 [Planctomycetia bacterium]|nr:hypothetical protein [Planctomycetia bacterium]